MSERPSGRLDQLSVDWPDLLHLAGGAERRIWVWLPESYDNNSSDYAVLFMHDGQNVFRDADATYGTCWRMIEAQSQLSHPMIVVGIEGQNDALRRFGEFSPWVNRHMDEWKGYQDPYAGGLADQYLAFLTETIVPEVHARYRCKTDPQHNWLGGSSMGGVVSLYAATRYENLFGRYLAVSTATWFAHESLMSCLRNHNFLSSTRVYADIGTEETSNPDRADFPRIYLDGNQALFELLSQQLAPGQFQSQIAQGAEHNEAAWAERLPGALSWLSH